MASRSFHALLLRARDHFAGSSHWAYLAILILALIHAVVITPFITGSRLESETSLQRTRLATVESSLGELRGALEAVRQETSSMVAPALDLLIEDLNADLARLDLTRRQIAARAAAELEAAAAEAGTGAVAGSADPATDTTGAIPTGATPEPEIPSNVRPFLIENPDQIADLREAQTRDELLAALAPLVDELITQPRFFDLERDWKDGALPRLEARLDTAASALPRLRSRFPEARDHWQALTAGLTALASTARELRFEPPAHPHWWLRAEGDEIDLGLAPAIADEIRRQRRLTDLETAADRTVESYSEIVGKVAQAKRELGDPTSRAFGGLDVAAVAMFPLLIGLVLGGTMAWRSQRLRELGFTLRLAIEHGGPTGLKQWFWSQAQWSTSAGDSAGSAWRACVMQTLLSYFLAMSWIALAAVQLRQLNTASRGQLLIYTLTGATSVLLAVIHRLLVARRAITLLDDVVVRDGTALEDTLESAAPHEAEHDLTLGESVVDRDRSEDDEFLEVRPLRR